MELPPFEIHDPILHDGERLRTAGGVLASLELPWEEWAWAATQVSAGKAGHRAQVMAQRHLQELCAGETRCQDIKRTGLCKRPKSQATETHETYMKLMKLMKHR